jgi:peptidoglycan/LPS O-acetylase OafA/YrhL
VHVVAILKINNRNQAHPLLKLSQILQRGENNFDLIRLIAAVTVIFGHSFYIFPTGGHEEPVTQLVQRNFSGTLAVGIFFFISGMLITQSYVETKSAWRFALMRAVRIYPGAVVCLLVTTLLLGPIVTSLSPVDYLTSSSTYCYIRDNWSFTTVLQAWSPVCAAPPGVFEKNRIPQVLNGSLWTLVPEVACYAYVLVIGLSGGLSSRVRIVLIIFALLGIHALAPRLIPFFSDDHYTDILKVALFFLAGTLAYACRDIIVLRWAYCAPLIIAAAALQRSAVQEYALYIALFYLILLVASSQRLRAIRFAGDYSFGVYIYGFPIQQSVTHYFPSLTSYPSNILCIPLALLAGYFSWFVIERPALSSGRRLAARKSLSAVSTHFPASRQ